MPRTLTDHIDNPKALGKRLKESRAKAGLSQRQLSFPGCTAAYISRLEAGARVPSLQMVNALAGRLEVEASWLATGKSADEPEAPILSIPAQRNFADGEVVADIAVQFFGDWLEVTVPTTASIDQAATELLHENDMVELELWVGSFVGTPGDSQSEVSSERRYGDIRLVVQGTVKSHCGLPAALAGVYVAQVCEQLVAEVVDDILADAKERTRARLTELLDGRLAANRLERERLESVRENIRQDR